MSNKKRAIFLDRDGVINKEVNYLSDPDAFVLIEGTLDALKLLKQKGFLLIVSVDSHVLSFQGVFLMKRFLLVFIKK